MRHQPNRTRTTRLALAALAVVLLGACSSAGGSTSTPAPTTAAARPASTAKLTILTPRNGQTLRRHHAARDGAPLARATASAFADRRCRTVTDGTDAGDPA